MAPELVADALTSLPAGTRVLDPMMGSGSFPLAAGRAGHRAIGTDTDPLAVLIARTGRCLWDTDRVLKVGSAVAQEASASFTAWAHKDPETDRFIDYWFDPTAKSRLGRLSEVIAEAPKAVQDPLWVAFSRLIVTKDSGASRARDVSHSRPHRVRDLASFDPLERFPSALRTVLTRALSYGPSIRGGEVEIVRADARRLPLYANSIDFVMTSPPYLTAIDYLRGHRMSLVWMGYEVAQLRQLRSSNIGAERGVSVGDDREDLVARYESMGFSGRWLGILARYVQDLDQLLGEIFRVVRPGGKAMFVVADATVDGRVVEIANMLQFLLERNGLLVAEVSRRELPSDRRYLPLPSMGSSNALARRMRTETVLTTRKV